MKINKSCGRNHIFGSLWINNDQLYKASFVLHAMRDCD